MRHPAENDSALMLGLPRAALGHVLGVGPELAGTLRDNVRLRPRLVAAMATRLGPLPEAPGLVVSRLLALDAAALRNLAACVGAVWFAPAVLRLLDGAAVRGFVEIAGEPARDAAWRWHDLAPAEDASCKPAPVPATELATRVLDTGNACLKAWCDIQPDAIGARVRLMLSHTEEPGAAHRDAGPGLIERIVAGAA